MGFMDWLRDKLGTTQRYIIEEKHIQMPGEGECLIFIFPRDAPKHIINSFDDRLVEFQNMERKFISTNLNIEIYKAPKKQLKTAKGGDNHEIFEVPGHPGHADAGQGKRRNHSADKKR